MNEGITYRVIVPASMQQLSISMCWRNTSPLLGLESGATHSLAPGRAVRIDWYEHFPRSYTSGIAIILYHVYIVLFN